ncbi:MAG: N-acetylmuramoyl-L-alanine amidase [Terrimicrobiaceae bacterium]|nr:N-acetylmuramoyl-L-alanine amidase [Terrimicrobiaceae bacterium]
MTNREANNGGQTKPHFRLILAIITVLGTLALGGCASSGRYGPGAGSFDTVVIDAGHGGHDSGARARTGVREKVAALDTARRLAAILRRHGLKVVETRTGDYFVTLGRRVEISNRHSSAIFVSVHYNWARRPGARGIETYFYGRRSERLAANIQREVLRVYPTENRGVKQRGFYVLRNNRRPAVLLELGFMSNSADNSKIQDPRVRQKLAERAAAGILAERSGREP